jgi:hypothetical protein
MNSPNVAVHSLIAMSAKLLLRRIDTMSDRLGLWPLLSRLYQLYEILSMVASIITHLTDAWEFISRSEPIIVPPVRYSEKRSFFQAHIALVINYDTPVNVRWSPTVPSSYCCLWKDSLRVQVRGRSIRKDDHIFRIAGYSNRYYYTNRQSAHQAKWDEY